MNETITNAIREKARELLEKHTVSCVIGYERATDNLTARPAFVYRPEEVDRLIFDETCAHNLGKYLLNRKDSRMAIVAKPCDARTVNLFINENQLQREKVFVIGIVCPGVVECRWGHAGKEPELRCRGCRQHTPPVFDHLIGDAVKEPEAPPDNYPDIAAMEGKTPEEREAFWRQQFQRCTRCYACRNICPGCYCPTCFVDLKEPLWAGIRVAPGENWMWNTVKAFHLLGRCVSCNECERSCPVNIPLSLLNRKLEKEVGAAFGFVPGMDPKALAPLATFKKDELS
ncbi:MAG: Fe-S oxidoreductase [Chloroflexi bacterium]|nr:Fe-S oxidoreductase [Chloroflexota bacterium]